MNDEKAWADLSRHLQKIANNTPKGKLPRELYDVTPSFKIVLNNLEQRVKRLEQALREASIEIPK
ncbi:hypothetical protein SAMN05660489_03706 [Pseudomonas sp. LAMO17WK12:I10]|uniref:hypothetical protein n=1 Tax=unclassified Pseudomonas TaxID=196821 RepID=UPI000BCDF03F|nr:MULTISPECIES: hypothetical protein [unclassified Pseudomonas]PXX63814.1 hypothetical protein H160_03918 [Pseudomonas sp. LAMO17WK12:I9]SNY39972.1 hypothetical protein SAMN05660489_03706 [Pseudomonas sp. LAMO17WK12:I10]